MREALTAEAVWEPYSAVAVISRTLSTMSAYRRWRASDGTNMVQPSTSDVVMVFRPEVVFPLRSRCWRPDDEFKYAHANSGMIKERSGCTRIR